MITSKHLHSILVLIAVITAGCTTTTITHKTSANDVSSEEYLGFNNAKVDEILILPVLVRGGKGSVITDPERTLAIPDENYTDMVFQIFEAYTDLDFSELPDNDFASNFDSNGMTKEGLFKHAVKMSEKTKISSVLFVMIDYKDNRTGGALGSERTSSAGYRMWLYNSEANKVIWSSAYQSNEEALTSNLLQMGDRLEKGLSFKTPNELLKNSFKASALKLSKDLERRFMSK